MSYGETWTLIDSIQDNNPRFCKSRINDLAMIFGHYMGSLSVREDHVSKTTRATLFLKSKGADFTVHTYDYDPNADRIGLQAAEALGVPPDHVLKTLMALVDGKPVCVVVPSDREVSMKKLAAVMAGKTAQMMKPADAERATGYVVGGISPMGQKKPVPTAIEEAALQHDMVFLNGGQRGLQVRLNPKELVRLLDARVASLVSD